MAAKKPHKLAPGDILPLALAHLARFSASEAGLRRVIARRIARAVAAHDLAPAPLAAALETAIDKLRAQGLIDDRRFAEAKTANWHRSGASARKIAGKLLEAGVDRDLAGAALADLAANTPESELAAARRYAERRRLGPYRLGGADLKRRQKDFAALARAGFSYAIAKAVLGATAEEMIEETDSAD